MRYLALAIAGVAGCAPAPTITEAPVPPGAVRPPDRLPPASPHAGEIIRVAVAERGDAAVSVDSNDEVRLWPTLDGTREPVRLDLGLPTRLSLAHASTPAGDEWVVAYIDHAGIAKLARVTPAGSPRGSATLAGDVAAQQIAAIELGVGADPAILVVRADQTIERYDLTGRRLGRLAADPGMRLGALAWRRGTAAIAEIARDAAPLPVPPAMIVIQDEMVETEHQMPVRGATATGGPSATAVRFIGVGTGDTANGDMVANGGLAWGRRLALPPDADPRALALSPNHRRLALRVGQLIEYFDVGDTLASRGSASDSLGSEPQLGFLDDDRIASFTAGIVKSAGSGDKVPPPSTAANAVGFADGVAVAAESGSLALLTGKKLRYLGWAAQAEGDIQPLGDGFVAMNGATGVHMDAVLGHERRSGVPTYIGDTYINTHIQGWLDDHHAVVTQLVDSKLIAAIIDDRTDSPTAHVTTSPGVALTELAAYGEVRWEPAQRIVAVGDTGRVHRFAVDADWKHVHELPDLQLPPKTEPGDATSVDAGQVPAYVLFDPTTHGGLVAVGAVKYFGRWQRAEWRDAGDGFGPTPTLGQEFDGRVLASDAIGGLYVQHDGIEAWQATGEPTKLSDDRQRIVVPTRDGAKVALSGNAQDVEVRDRTGKLLWKRDVWAPVRAAFSADGSRLVVQTVTGLIALDGATGARLATACGFEFGLHDEEPPAPPSVGPTVCED